MIPAVMVYDQIIPLSFHKGSTVNPLDMKQIRITVNNGIGSIDQSIFIPLVTAAVLPPHSAYIAKLSTTSTSWGSVSRF